MSSNGNGISCSTFKFPSNNLYPPGNVLANPANMITPPTNPTPREKYWIGNWTWHPFLDFHPFLYKGFSFKNPIEIPWDTTQCPQPIHHMIWHFSSWFKPKLMISLLGGRGSIAPNVNLGNPMGYLGCTHQHLNFNGHDSRSHLSCQDLYMLIGKTSLVGHHNSTKSFKGKMIVHVQYF